MHRIDRRGNAKPQKTELPTVQLEIARGRAQQKCREVRGTAFLIGTAADCDLVLADPRFDELHSYLFITPTGVTIRQLGEGPALTVDGQAVRFATLDQGSLIEMGPYAFRVQVRWPQSTAAEARRQRLEALAGSLPMTSERALDRLLADIVAASAAPQLGLYVEESNPAELRPKNAAGAWRAPGSRHRQASY